jgi:hydroxymethylbilane synthase
MLPIALHTGGRRALIAGGGEVAVRNAQTLVDAGVRLHVVAPKIDVRLRTLLEYTDGTFALRPYESADVSGNDLVIAATDDHAVNAKVIEDARAARIFACNASAPESGDFTMQASLRVGDLTFSVDAARSTPAFARRLVREIADRFGAPYAAAARTLARMRTYVFTVAAAEERAPVMRALAELPVDRLAAMNAVEAEHEAEAAIARLRSSAATVPTTSVTCASRASALAMTQSRMVAARLAERGIATSILPLTTTGDRVQDRSIASIGSENVWIKELELALRDGRADYAVHSCKDLPSTLEPDMLLAAFSAREDPRDAFCSERFARFEDLPAGAVVGTSSARRRAQLQALRPDLRFEPIRGNVDTRLQKLRSDGYDAIILAMAGLERLHLRARHTVPFPVDSLVPAVAQGVLAVEVRANDDRLASELRSALNDREAELCVCAERAALRALRAGCDAPLGVHARLEGTRLHVDAVYLAPGSAELLRERLEGDPAGPEDAAMLGRRLGECLAERIGAIPPKGTA